MTMQPDGHVLTEKVWNRLRHDGRLVRDEVTGDLPPMVRSLAWQQFQQMPAARWACSLIQLIEPQQGVTSLYHRRTRRPMGAGLFDDIPSPMQRAKAEKIYAKLCERHAERLPSCPWPSTPSWPVEHALRAIYPRGTRFGARPTNASHQGRHPCPKALSRARLAPARLGAKGLGIDRRPTATILVASQGMTKRP